MKGRELKSGFVELMLSDILSGRLRPGDRLPPERELAEKLGMSRGSVNQGVLDLERMGFLRVVPRKGTFVADYMKNATPGVLSAIMSHDSGLIDPSLFKDFMQLRILIERECARLACEKINTAGIAMLREWTEALYSAEEDGLADALYTFHHGLTVLSGNAAYTIIFQCFEPMITALIRKHYENRAELKKCLPLYFELANAITQGDAAAADRYISAILNHASDYLNRALA